jgi:cell wall-associated NlpC family hydrolase
MSAKRRIAFLKRRAMTAASPVRSKYLCNTEKNPVSFKTTRSCSGGRAVFFLLEKIKASPPAYAEYLVTSALAAFQFSITGRSRMENWKKGLLIGLFSSMLWEQHAVAAGVGLKRMDASAPHRVGFQFSSETGKKSSVYPVPLAGIAELWQERLNLARQPFVPGPDADCTEGIASRLILVEMGVHDIPVRVESRPKQPLHHLVVSRGGMLTSAQVQQQKRQEVKQQKPQGQQAVSNPAPTINKGSGATATKGGKAVSIAMQYQGVPYKYGGASPQGFDCSGFIQFVYGQLGIALPRTTYAQFGAGVQVAQSDLQPGDLIFFSCNGRATSHAGIYIGNGQFIHADADRGIMVASLSNPYWAGVYQAAVRVG